MSCLILEDVLSSGRHSDSNRLCPACQPLFEFIMRGDERKCSDCQLHPDFHLHTQDQYHASMSACPGCRLINSFFRFAEQNTSKNPVRNLLVQSRRFDLSENAEVDHRVRFHGGLLVLIDSQQQMTPIGRILANEKADGDSPYVEHISRSRYNFGFPEGRIVPSTVNTDLIRAWMQSCSLNHQQCRTTHRKSPVPLRLIDLEHFKVTEATSCQRYVALSYVWGKNTEPLLTRERLPKLSLQGGIQEVDIPRTIANAMQFSRDIGYRYIWVDSMCIVQDDADDKKMQHPIMGQIYGDADLVMVAAAGDSAHAGLPGVGGNAREGWQQVENIGRWEFITTDPKVSWVVNGTHWNTRGWTFQEAYLARRILIFTKTQVFWICQEMTWREDTSLESQPVSPESNGLESLWGSADEYDENLSKRRCRTRQYCRNVEIFSERSFKDESDSLWAYTGILEAQLASFPQGYIWGVPFEIMDTALLWKFSCGTTHQGNIPRKLTTGLTHGAAAHPVPSWAWLSSAHSVAFQTLCGNLVSEVSWLSPIDLESSYNFSIWNWVLSKSSKLKIPNSTPEPKPNQTNNGIHYKYLPFSANTAELTVFFDGNAKCKDAEFRGNDENHGLLGLWWKRMFNIDGPQRMISALWPSSKPRDDNPPRTLIRQASVLLAGQIISRLSIPEDYLRHGSERLGQFILLSSNTEDKEDDRCITSSDPLDCGNIIHVADCDHVISHNVMLIEWKGRIAYRRALGVINKEDWAKVTVQKRNIVLG